MLLAWRLAQTANLLAALGGLLKDGELDALHLRESNAAADALARLVDDEAVRETGGEAVAGGVLDPHDGERARVLLHLHELAHAASVTALGDHDDGADLALDALRDLAGRDVHADGVTDLDHRVRVADGAAVVGDDVRDLLGRQLATHDLAELEGSLVGRDRVQHEAALVVVDDAEAVDGGGLVEALL